MRKRPVVGCISGHEHGGVALPCGIAGDCFLLYTDGVIEPENAGGGPFGDCKLEEVVRNYQSRSPSELSDQLLSEIRFWQPASLAQQDDITLIVIDVV